MSKEINKVLVTGGGFIGTTVTKQLLEKNYKVRVVDNFWKSQHCDGLLSLARYPGFEFMVGDVSDVNDVEKMLDGCDAILHGAAIVGAPLSERHKELSKLYTAIGTSNVARYKKSETPMILMSTGSCYGRLDEICTEKSPVNPQSTYGRHKLEAEQHTLNTPNGAVYRFSTAMGIAPAMRLSLMVNDFVWKAYYEKYITVFESHARRSFIDVYDIGRSLVFGLENFDKLIDDENKIYNIGSDKNNYSKQDIINFLHTKLDFISCKAEIGKDLDQRDYIISHRKINEKGFEATITLEESVDMLINSMPLYNSKDKYL